MRFAVRVAISGFLLVVSWAASLCWSLQNQPDTPPIRSTTHLVQFSVIVRDRNGAVMNLAKDDFVVKDRGKIQPISVFSMDAPRVNAKPTQPLPPDTYSDLAGYEKSRIRSVTIVLLDNLNTLYGSSPQPYESTPGWLEDHALTAAKQHLMEFLGSMDPSDRIAIYGLTDKLRVLCDFTCDRNQLLAVVGKYDATSQSARESVEPGSFHLPNVPKSMNQDIDADTRATAASRNEERAEITMSALTAITAHVADVPGHKNLLWLTANLPFSGEAIARVLAHGNIAAYPIDARGLLPRGPLVSMEDLGEATPLALSSAPTGIGAMEEMAADTGGHAFVNTNDLTGAIRSVVEDSAVTYTLGFYLPESEVDGRFHKITVQVKQAGLNVNSPRGYFAYRDTETSENESHSAFLTAVRSPLDASALPLVVKIRHVSKPESNSVEILGAVGLKDVQIQQDGGMRKGRLDVYIIEQDMAGKVLHQGNQRLNLKLTQEQYISYLRMGILFHQVLQPRPGTTVLRVLVQDHGSTRVGSVIIPFVDKN